MSVFKLWRKPSRTFQFKPQYGRPYALTLATAGLLIVSTLGVQAAINDAIKEAAKGLKMRSIGPAMMGGRIADIAIHPDRENQWFVAVGSGGVWRTDNAGTTWTPIFDKQGSYSIGDVTVDPNNPDVVWVGTGENVSGRHVGWGDGVYRSGNGGKTWTNMGLENSEHVGRILIDPRDSNVIFVAAEGPLWSAGGERGLYKSTDAGNSWERVLEIDKNTGVTDVAFNPANPDVMYAAAYERRRHVWGFMAGGPNSGIYKSTDGGETWTKKTEGLPDADMGKIGLAVTPANPDLVYATIESDKENKGFYRSADQAESWTKQNDYISGGTGPHYYQELAASPQTADLVYQMDVFFRVTRDGGKTFSVLGTGREKHSDNHALWIDPENDNHLLAGSDAGLYESFDQGTTWRHFPNLPISQFYKIAVDNSEPFYNILGGTQDLGTLYGPSRTTITEGVRNQDWYVPLGADGHSVVFDPSDNNVAYMTYQQGYMFRHHKDSDELVHIQPQPAPSDPPERWNWDTPIMISPHDASRVYVGSQRVWRSDDRGNSWQAISQDLTTDQNRYEKEYAGRVWSVDALHDNGAMSKYATITTITESPVSEGTIFVGADDGSMHATSDGGETWQSMGVLPSRSEPMYVNDMEASLFDAQTVYAVGDNHKIGDYSPFVYISRNLGKSWQSIAGDLPSGVIVWAIQQDHEDKDLLFIGAEDGAYFSVNGGENWTKLAGAPTISFRDIKIQRRDNDLVGATFGRGIYILDDYTALRELDEGFSGKDPALFPVRDAWWYVPSVPSQAVGMPTFGSDSFRAKNPEFGATFSYFLPEELKTAKAQRKTREKDLRKDGSDIAFPGWAKLASESLESEPKVLLMVRDAKQQPVRWLTGPIKQGTHRVAWDLRLAPPDAIDLSKPDFKPPWITEPTGPLVAPGEYSVQLYSIAKGEVNVLSEPQSFAVKPVREASAGMDYAEVAAFQQQAAILRRQVAHANEEIKRTRELLKHMQAAALHTQSADASLITRVDTFGVQLAELTSRLTGDPIRQGLDEASSPSIAGRAYNAATNWNNTQPATATQRADYEIANKEFVEFKRDLDALLGDELSSLEEALLEAGAPSWR